MFLTLLAQTTSPSPGTSSPGSGLGSLIIFLPLVLLLFFSMRKQGRQRRMHQEMVSAIGVGDEIESVAGIFGTVKRATDEHFFVELAPGLEVKMSRAAVRRKVVQLDAPPAAE